MHVNTSRVNMINFGSTTYSWDKGARAPVSSLKDFVKRPLPVANSNGTQARG